MASGDRRPHVDTRLASCDDRMSRRLFDLIGGLRISGCRSNLVVELAAREKSTTTSCMSALWAKSGIAKWSRLGCVFAEENGVFFFAAHIALVCLDISSVSAAGRCCC